MSRPLVTVVTPSLNPGWRLQRCLTSVALQSYPSVEHLVLDGGSTDGTLDVLQAARGIRWTSEADEGQADALCKGMDLAEGALLTWLNADDEFLPGAIERAVKGFESGAEWIYSDCWYDLGGTRHAWRAPRKLTKNSFDIRCVIPQQGCFFGAAAYRRVGGLDRSFHLAMDFDLWLRFLDADVKAFHVSDFAAVFEVHDDSKTGSIPYREFLIEGARALVGSGRIAAAAAMLGQAAGTVAGAQGEPVVLDEEIERVYKDAESFAAGLNPRVARSAAYAEAAARGVSGGSFESRNLLRPSIWMRRHARRRLKEALMDRVRIVGGRWLRRVGLRRPLRG